MSEANPIQGPWIGGGNSSSWIFARDLFGLASVAALFVLGLSGCQNRTANESHGEDPADADPKLTARLRAETRERFWKDLVAFENLPLEDQHKLVEFHDRLVALGPVERQRLWHGAELFSIWLHGLPEEEKNQFFAIADNAERVAFVRKKREEQWLVNLPKADQDRIKALDADRDDRALLISRLKIEETERRTRTLELLLKPPVSPPGNPTGGSAPGANPKAGNFPGLFFSPRHARLDEMPKEVQKWVVQQLTPRLTQAELSQLKKAEGQWPLYPRTIYQLSRDHFLLPSRPTDVVTHYQSLPGFIREKLPQEKLEQVFRKKGLTPKTEQWPDFALSVSQILKDQNAGNALLGPCNLNGLPKTWRALVEKELLPKLDSEGKAFLRRAEGKWPDYPRNLVDLFMIRGIAIPGNPLPGPLGIWRDALTPATPPN